ncbi:MAG TPA: MlaD family protein, partial [Novosphingobium sp.]|nr:MlaD family protein [Novosphingobium sp.]
MRAHWGETAMGFVVLALAGLFLVYSLGVAHAGRSGQGYELTARVGDSGGLAPGAKVTIGGVKIGSVTAVTLDPKSYLAVIHLSVDSTVPLPTDSTAKITT